jgi:chromosome segregation ATPase
LLSNPNASISELQRADEILSTAWPKLKELEQSYDNLDAEDKSTQELRNRTADKLSKLNELFNNNRQSTKDRVADMLKTQQDKLSDMINQCKELLNDPSALPQQLDDNSTHLLNLVSDAQETKIENDTLRAELELQLKQLNNSAALGLDVFKALTKKFGDWYKFQQLRDEITERQQNIQTVIQSVQQQEPQPLADVKNKLQLLNVRISYLI